MLGMILLHLKGMRLGKATHTFGLVREEAHFGLHGPRGSMGGSRV